MNIRSGTTLGGWLVLAAVGLGTGCASTAMKGTPFYTGEHEVRTGPVEDRVNLWPLLYYRAPALSVLWPIGEVSPQHLAVRPLYSVYGRDTDDPEYNVLWPLAQFRPKTGEHHIFPFFWGPGYTVGFPLYWHLDRENDTRGTHALFPFWILNHHGDVARRDFLWPLIHHRTRAEQTEAWRVWPLIGWRLEGPESSWFYLWPLGRAWDSPGERGHHLIPLYGHVRAADGTGWTAIMPLGGWSVRPDGGSWVALPLLSGGTYAEDRHAWWALGPLVHRRVAPDVRNSHVLPLYMMRTSPDAQTFLSLPWSQSRREDGSGWQFLPPLVYRDWNEVGNRWITPLYAHRHRADGSGWQLVPPLVYRDWSERSQLLLTPLYARQHRADGTGWTGVVPIGGWSRTEDGGGWIVPLLLAGGRHRGEDRSWWALGPLVHGEREGDRRYLHVAPLFMRRAGGDETAFVSLPWSHVRRDDGSGWQMAPPFVLRTWDDRGTTFASPLYATSRDAEGQPRWTLAFPLFYRQHEPAMLVTLPYVYRDYGDGEEVRAIPPLWSWVTTTPERSDLRALGLVANWSWGEEPGRRWILPLFVHNPQTRSVVSIPYARWTGTDGWTHRAVPPLLSWSSTRGEAESRRVGLAGIYADRRSGEERSQHLLPLFARRTGERPYWASLPYAQFVGREGWNHQVIPPLVSWRSERGDDQRRLMVAGGLYADEREQDRTYQHLLPLYSRQTGDDPFWFSLLFGWRRDARGDGWAYGPTPLIGWRTGEERGSWVFPLYSHRSRPDLDRAEGSFLLAGRYLRSPDRAYTRFPLVMRHEHRTWVTRHQDEELRNSLTTTGGLLLYRRERREGLVRHGGAPTAPGVARSHRLFPLFWDHRTATPDGDLTSSRGRSLLVYDYLFRRGLEKTEDEAYVRRRLLWRFWHYEREGDSVSVDLFPGIAYDRRGDAYRQVSFLWRFFRYERKEAGRSLDVLFIPLRRP